MDRNNQIVIRKVMPWNRVALLAVVLLSSVFTMAQRTVVGGTVKDATTGLPVAGASIRAGGYSVVSNSDGQFTLKSERKLEKIEVSHLGYRTKKVSVDGTAAQGLVVNLAPASITLHEVMVMADNARELVRTAIGKIPQNYSQSPELYHCFYRETAMKRQHFICVAEGVVDMYKTGYEQEVKYDHVAINKGRRLLSPKRSDTLSVKVLGGPVTPVVLDLVKNRELLLNAEELDCYDMKMEVPTAIGERMQYVVRIAPRRSMPYPLYFGRLYIDQQTLAFTRAELSLDMSNREKATQMMLVKKPTGVRFRPKELSLLVDYRLDDDGMTRISYLRTTFRFNCDWRRRLFATSFTACCEMAVTNSTGGDVRPIYGRKSFDQYDAFFDRVDYFRDPDFWQDYNIIDPTETLDKAVKRLLKKN